VSLSTELRLNGLHRQERTPELRERPVLGRGDQFKLILAFAFQHRQHHANFLRPTSSFAGGRKGDGRNYNARAK